MAALGMHDYLVPGTDEVFYIPEFVSAEEEAYLLQKIQESPVPRWKQLANRRLQIWGGTVTAKGALVPEPLPQFVTKYPDIVGRIQATGAFASSPHAAPNHVIMNEYLPGQGIMPHEDGPAYYPTVATLSLGGHAVFHYYRYKSDIAAAAGDPEHTSKARAIDPAPAHSLLLEPRSLVVTRAALYTAHLHGIDDLAEDVFAAGSAVANAALLRDERIREVVRGGGALRRETRCSLTCRDVAKVVAVGKALKR